MNKFIEIIHRFYDVSYSVTEKKSIVFSQRKIISVYITFTPKKYFPLTPEVVESKATYHAYPSGTIDFYDMIYIRPHEMPLLKGLGTNSIYYLDEWLETESWAKMYEKLYKS